MSVPTLTDMIARVRDRVQDADASVADAEITREINAVTDRWTASLDDRPRDLTASASGLSTSTGVRRYTVSNTVPVRRPRRLFTASGASSTTPLVQLEWLEPAEMEQEYALDQTSGTPAYWTAYRQGTATAADVGKWIVELHPPPSGTFHYILRALVDPTALSGGTDKPDLDPAEAWAVCDVASYRVAVRMGRDEQLCESIRGDIPEAMQAVFGLKERAQGPRPRPGEEAA